MAFVAGFRAFGTCTALLLVLLASWLAYLAFGSTEKCSLLQSIELKRKSRHFMPFLIIIFNVFRDAATVVLEAAAARIHLEIRKIRAPLAVAVWDVVPSVSRVASNQAAAATLQMTLAIPKVTQVKKEK